MFVGQLAKISCFVFNVSILGLDRCCFHKGMQYQYVSVHMRPIHQVTSKCHTVKDNWDTIQVGHATPMVAIATTPACPYKVYGTTSLVTTPACYIALTATRRLLSGENFCLEFQELSSGKLVLLTQLPENYFTHEPPTEGVVLTINLV